MVSNPNNIELTQSNSNQFNLKKLFSLFYKKWYWFILSILICLGIAFINLRYTTPVYAAFAKIMLLDDEDKTSGTNALNDLSIFSNNDQAKVDDEIQVITSRDFFKNIVNKLNLNIQYFVKGKVFETELYKSSPVIVTFIASDSVVNKTNFNFYIEIYSDLEFGYRINEDDEPKKISFGKEIKTPFGGMILTPNDSQFKGASETDIRIQLSPVIDVAENFRNRIGIYRDGESGSKILNLSLTDAIPQKAKDVINALIVQYNTSSLELKNKRSENTANFINERVQLIASDLVNVDDSIVRFKTGNKVTNVTSEAGQFLASSAQNEQQLDAARNQLRQLNYMKESLGDDSSSFQPIPVNLGLGDAVISGLSSKYNELLANRKRLLMSAGSKNAIIVELDNTLNGIKQNLQQSINNSSKSINITLNSLENQSSRINSKIFSVPGQESKLRSIERKQGIKESLYLYLLQKREEATIALTATSPNVKIIDEAYDSGGSISPNRKTAYLLALFIGFLIPFSIIYISDLLDNKIHNKEDLETEIKNITVLGEIPKVSGKKGEALLVEKNDRSILSESFRIVRTNFDYVRRGRNVENYDNVIFITSTIKGEGKSFFSINTALTMANTSTRVLLIGADIRNPQIYNTIKNQIKPTSNEMIGLTEYLVDKTILAGETINSYTINGIKLDILFSGKTPPNPAELLMTDRVKELFDYASSQYDIVIVDTAPAMLVTDTLLLSEYAGHTIYLTRAGYTEKQVLNFAKELHANKKLNGMMLVVNDVHQENFGYGAQYGYYGTPEKKSFFKRLF
ncbi:GumC family protein [Mariniflexile sp. AS56]|uniref:GumC family protein n=1 Tax=Mariniflexile sp. AS56 TaxID=3063957 RepID=UPI0026ED6637|nr:tyrosine-protein kinase [Mariniflexile sp. AS56]MDO7171385.1 polysaccharide biosynthesis tyrosine autokinase [Mariniflexile sp. AS56]